MTEGLFSNQTSQVYVPLAARLRPQTLDDYVGQEHLLGPDKPLRQALAQGLIHSMIFWGPPGVGKTTLAKLMAHNIDAQFITLSAVMVGVKDIRKAIQQAEIQLEQGRRTLLFIDEVHRFNKTQQDAFLPFVENGLLTFIGATTENPSFELNNALLSRCRVYVLRSLSEDDIKILIRRALKDDHSLAKRGLILDADALALLSAAASGDARRALNLLEIASDLAAGHRIDKTTISEVLSGDIRRFDKDGDHFYEQISALHKAVRGSAPDAALYWCLRMLDGGCDPLYIARRVVRMAVEDIGNADPRALEMALSAWDTQERLGSPEGELAIGQAVLYLAAAPKSNAVYNAFNAVKADIVALPDYEVPVHLRNAPTKLMKELEYGADYRYAHDEEGAFAAGENYFPEALMDKQYYFPVDRGLETRIKEKLDDLRQQNTASQKQR